MNNVVLTKSFSQPEINRSELLRYASVGEETTEIGGLLDECIGEALPRLDYRVCYRAFRVSDCGDTTDLGFCKTESAVLKKYLSECEYIILFAATVGVEIDRLIKKYSHLSPAKATLLQALGSERVESLCDEFSDEIKAAAEASGYTAKPRVSAGYGDIPLSMQRDIFLSLDCSRKIGVTLGESLLMTPEKSVTAIIGIKKK